MAAKHGVETGKFGRWLSQCLEETPGYQSYCVYYDHGDRLAAPNVVAIKGFFGETVTNANRLADVDIIVVKPGGEIAILIEIEESGTSPKKLVGDVFTILMCNRFAVRDGEEQRCFEITPETRLVVAGVGSSGQQTKKVREVIAPRLGQFEASADGIKLRNVRLIIEKDLPAVLDKLAESVRESLAIDREPEDVVPL
ncbi:hypothetical protein GF348_24155 [candidate division KSB3 bacterium]|nr:hypothetical protein [candidate division KSB3 bacterium]